MGTDTDVRRIAILTYPGCFFGEAIKLLEILTSPSEPLAAQSEGKTRNLIQIYSLTGGRVFSPSSRLIYMDTLMIQGPKPADLDLLIIAHGTWAVTDHTSELSCWLRAVCPGAKQIVALGSGVIRLAAAGLLNHRRVTTHSALAPLLAENYPLVCVDALLPMQIDGNIYTTNEHINLSELALRLMKRPLSLGHRLQHQAASAPNGGGLTAFNHAFTRLDSIAHRVILWWLAHIDEDISMERSAVFLSMSERSFRRHFKTEVGYSPYLFLLLLRLELARQALIDSNLPIDKIARRGGLHDGQQLARMFRKFIETSPHQYRTEICNDGLPVPHPVYAALFDGRTTPPWLHEMQFAAKRGIHAGRGTQL